MTIGFGPLGWDLDLKAGIWASRLEFGPKRGDLTLGSGQLRRKWRRRKRRGKFPICVEARVIDPFGSAARKERKAIVGIRNDF